MNCPACGHVNREDAHFCGECAAPLGAEVACLSCGRPNPVGQRFCDGCGHPLGPPAAPIRERSPRDYTPKHLAEKILQSKSALEGERKQVTVLFADVRHSLELAETLDPEEWHRILDRFFQILADGVHRFEGTVNQYTGDGIMALFGAPIAHEDHAQRACYAALHLRDAVRAYADELRLREGLDFAVRIGLHSGEVVVGKIGDDLRMDYTAQGHTVGLAQRMEALAAAGSIYLSGAMADRVSGYFALRDLGEAQVKGASEPVRVFELTGLGPHHSRFDVARARGLTRFVGREDDLTTLAQALEQARAGNGQVVGVVAEAGTGKSRLCFEFLERCRARGIPVYQAGAVAHGKNIPYLPILQLMRAYFGITEQDAERSAREKIAGRLLLIDEELRELLPLLFEFLGVPDPARPAPPMDPDARQRRLYSVLQRVVALRTDPVVVTLLEDLHWIDAASEGWLEQMVANAGGSRSLYLVNFRPEYHAGWMGRSWYRQLPLTPLGSEAIRELLADLLGTDPSLAGLAEAIHARTAGNPFFTEEVVQGLIEAGNLAGTKGSYRLAIPIERLAVPSTVQAVLAARIDRLGEREKQVLQTAAVIGKEFSEPVLAKVTLEVSGIPARELADALRRLEDGEFVREASLYPVAVYAFKHPLTQEVALGSQLRERRRRTHGAVGRALEETHRERLDENAALLAHHCEEAGETLAAARWHRRAAEWLFQSNAAEALGHWRHVHGLARALPDDREALLLSVAAIRMLLSNVWRIGMEPAQWEALAEEGRALAARLGDRRLLLDVELGVFLAHLDCGYASDGVEPLRRAVELAEALGDLESRVFAGNSVTNLLMWEGKFREALPALEELERLAAEDPSIGVETYNFSIWNWAVGRQALVLAWLGRPDEAARPWERAERVARERGELDVLAVMTIQRVRLLAWLTGRTENAVHEARQALELAERSGSPISQVWVLDALAVAHLCTGHPDQALEALEQAVSMMRDRRLARQEFAYTLGALAQACLETGDPERALALAEEGTSYGRRAGTRGVGLYAELVVARARIARGEHAEAEASLARCDALVEETGAAAVAPFATELRARLAAARGEDPAGLLRTARRQFEAVGATGHAERLARELAS